MHRCHLQTGVYMHDVVRDYCRAGVGPDQLRVNQRRVARRLLASTPDGGWLEHSSSNALHGYVASSLRFHLSGCVDPDAPGGVASDTELCGWVEVNHRYMSDFFAKECANVIGADVLKALAADDKEKGNLVRAALALPSSRIVGIRYRA